MHVHGQNTFFENINLQTGLPSENIYDLYKDSKGYIWCTSEIGLLRFNGKNFKLFDNNSNLSKSGSFISEDSAGRIWYQTFEGYFFYVENNQLKQLNSKESSSFKSYAIHNNFLYRIIDSGILKIDLNTMNETLFIKGNSYVFCHILGDWLYYGNKTVYRKNLKNNITEKVIQLKDEFRSLVTFSNKKLIAIADRSSAKTPFILLNTNGIIQKSTLTLNETLQNVYLLDNEIWCFTQSGIYKYNYLLNSSLQSTLLEGKNVSSYIKGANNYIWIGSPTNGIYLIKDFNSREFSLENDEFSSITQKEGFIFTGTNSGKIYKHTPNLKSQLYYNTFENNHIFYMDFYSFNNWNFFTGNGLFSENVSTKKVYRNYSSVKKIVKVNDSTVGVASTGYSGVVHINNLLNDLVDTKKLLHNLRAKSCAYDAKNKHFYTATNKGLFRINLHNKASKILIKNEPIFAKKLVFANDTLWGITNNGNAFYLSNNKVSFFKYNIAFNTLKVYNKQFYLSSKNAIYKVKNNKIQKINAIGSLYRIIDFELFNDNLYLITTKKLIKIPLKSNIIYNEIPKIFVNSITFNNTVFKNSDLKKIPYNYNSVVINFEILNFDDVNEYEYYYYMNGKAFVLDNFSEKLIFHKLQSGKYTIGFKIYNKKTNQIVFSTQANSFTILLPFWKTWWFLTIVFIALLMGIYIVYKLQIKKINKKNKIKLAHLTLENNLKESKLQLIKSQMNPHFFFNAINNIQSYIFTNETKEASLYLSKFSKLTRKILEFSEVNTITLKEEISSLQLYLELQQMRFKDLHFTINTHNITNTELINIPTMMYQPYVENALLHGLSHSLKQKKLIIDFKLDNSNTLIGIITDNGIGRKKSEELNQLNLNKPKSFATKANLERIQLLNKNQYKITVNYIDLHNNLHESTGTQVIIKIELSWNT
jgi:sensor histidine kinase YesM